MMRGYLSLLSRRQRGYFAATLTAAVLIVLFGLFMEPDGTDKETSRFTTEMSIKEIAPRLEVTGKALARDLGLPLDAPKKKPLEKLNISQENLDRVIVHLLSHRSGPFKYYVYGALVLFGLVFLTRLGRPDGVGINQRKLWYPRTPYLAALVVALVVCGLLLGKSPNPMEGIVKVFKSMVGLYPSVWEKIPAFLFFIALALVGNKLVCGWACPFGALQELFYSLPALRKMKGWKPPFWLTNTIRGGLFVSMLLLLFGLVEGKEGFVIYHLLNPFNLFDFDVDEGPVLATILAALVLSFILYRPFCSLVCPFGFVSWIVERFSLVQVRIDHDRCTKCGACVHACPSHAAGGRVERKWSSPDCFSCARCLNVCPEDAIRYRPVFRKGRH